jgi:hypothetical protein
MSCYCKQGTNENFFSLKGKTITRLEIGDNTYIDTSDGCKYLITHFQDCCESVGHYRTIGDIENVLNFPITLAEDDRTDDPEWYKDETPYREGYTWSAYFLETEKGRVEIWFYGTSNGYYSESMSFVSRCKEHNP